MTARADDSAAKMVRSGVRKHASYGPLHILRRWWVTRGAGHVGVGVHVDRNVRLLRYAEKIRIGDGVMLKEGVRLCVAQPDAIVTVGPRTTVGYHTFMFASTGITVGEDCLIAPFCYFVDADHGIEAGTPIRAQDMTATPIVVGDDVWLGVGVKVLAGARIESGAVVAAGAVVRSRIPENAIAAGVPAEVKGYRR